MRYLQRALALPSTTEVDYSRVPVKGTDKNMEWPYVTIYRKNGEHIVFLNNFYLEGMNISRHATLEAAKAWVIERYPEVRVLSQSSKKFATQ